MDRNLTNKTHFQNYPLTLAVIASSINYSIASSISCRSQTINSCKDLHTCRQNKNKHLQKHSWPCMACKDQHNHTKLSIKEMYKWKTYQGWDKGIGGMLN